MYKRQVNLTGIKAACSLISACESSFVVDGEVHGGSIESVNNTVAVYIAVDNDCVEDV